MSHKKSDDNARRTFLKGAGSLSLVLAAGIPLLSANATSASADGIKNTHIPVANAQVFHVAVRGNLYDSPTDVDVYPGELSEPLLLHDRGTVRIKIALAGTNPKFGPFYLLTITDKSGKPLSSMNVGSNTTATFPNLGIQVYLLSVQQSS